MEKKIKTIIILSAFILIFMIIGGTLAYFRWASSTEQKTNVTFTVASGFSCSADGGGSLTSNDIQLAPAACTNTTYAIKRTITVHPTITQANKTIYLDMWLKVNSIASNLSASKNFKYALTTSSSNCTTDVVTHGNFWLAETGTQRYLLQDKMYTSTTTKTYYLWVWLDSAETNSNTMNQAFDIELGGTCTDEAPNYVYTVNWYNSQNQANTEVQVGQSIPSAIRKFYDPNGPSKAIEALENAYLDEYDDLSTELPFFLRHKVFNNIVIESYLGFVITSTMAANNSGMSVGTYYLKGGDSGVAYNNNRSVLLSAFGSNNCINSSTNLFSCNISGFHAGANDIGDTWASETITEMECGVAHGGGSSCEVDP